MKRLILAGILAAIITASASAQTTNLTILTGSTSGVYYPLGNAISGIFGQSIPGVRSSVQVTRGFDRKFEPAGSRRRGTRF